MNFSNCLATTAPTTMPGISSDPVDDFSSAASLKKRKRDQDELVNLGHASSFIASSFHPLNSSIRLDCPDGNRSKQHPLAPIEGNELSFRPRCLPRKRRVLQPQQQTYLHPHSQQWPLGFPPSAAAAAQAKLLSPSICVPSTHNFSSPPVSPKTLVPLSYPHHQQPNTTSASSLRPCHICYRRPTTREVLDAYANCDLCGQRACYICLRQCDAIDCRGLADVDVELLDSSPTNVVQDDGDESRRAETQRRKICSSCAVEGVTDTGVEVVRCVECAKGQASQ